MKPYRSIFFLVSIFLITSFNSFAQTFEAYLQYNYKWNGRTYTDDGSSFTSTTFAFSKSQLKIDNSLFTVINRIKNSSGDYLSLLSNEDRSIKISIVIDLEVASNGRKFQRITVERPLHYKIRYYIK